MLPGLNPKAIYDIAIKDSTYALSIFTPYDLVITAPNDVVVEIGRFSLTMLPRIHVIPPLAGGARVMIGAFCQAASQSTILVGGNHANDSLFNYSFGRYAEYYRHFMGPDDRLAGEAPTKPIVIGDNVILSRGATVLDSASIGTGSVIAAEAVVTRACDPLGIYGGVPAKLIRKRFDDRMADLYAQIDLPNICAHSLPTLPSKIARLEAGGIDVDAFRASVEYLTARPKVHLSASIKDHALSIDTLNGFSVGGKPVDDPAIVGKLQHYFSQPVSNPTSLKWSPDIFYALGLVGPLGAGDGKIAGNVSKA